jgi:hypothetical protein
MATNPTQDRRVYFARDHFVIENHPLEGDRFVTAGTFIRFNDDDPDTSLRGQVLRVTTILSEDTFRALPLRLSPIHPMHKNGRLCSGASALLLRATILQPWEGYRAICDKVLDRRPLLMSETTNPDTTGPIMASTGVWDRLRWLSMYGEVVLNCGRLAFIRKGSWSLEEHIAAGHYMQDVVIPRAPAGVAGEPLDRPEDDGVIQSHTLRVWAGF